eukprot:TRINITY_DN30630_c0_g1_i1.p1 TRINITY_DN30630_c0_g1~~TRINITY_DN30630_c0_g1_i1.p1  ORF type:complete len:411 (+),score=88.76 TRINITY_DN30630_c0_g1_i1:61-1293(+)
MQASISTDDELSLHPSQYSDTGDLLDLNNKLDDVTLQFKKMVLDAVKYEKARMAAIHKKEIERIESRHEEERNELIRQRDECRKYWYHHKEVNDRQWQSLIHRAETFAFSAATRENSVWKMCPELQKRAYDRYPYFKTALKRQAFNGWKQWLRTHKTRKTAQKATLKLSSYKSQSTIFTKWKTSTLEVAAAKRERHLKEKMSLELMTVTNNKEAELQSLSEQVTNLRKQLAIETQHRGALEERLKIAFMRGVCALNLEAMQVMKTEDERTIDEQQQTQQRMREEEAVVGDSEILHSDPVINMSSAHVKSFVNRSVAGEGREGINISATRQPLVQSVAPGAVSAIIPSGSTAASDRSIDAHSPSPTRKSRPPSQQSRRRPPLGGVSVTRSSPGGIASALTVKELHPVRRYG